jgi:hypothetical protein
MSFSKTISVCAALTTIFLAAGTGYKLSQDTQKEVPLNQLDQKVMELEKKLEEVKEPQVAPDSGVQQPITPPAPVLPQPITPPVQVVQPPLTPPPPVLP